MILEPWTIPTFAGWLSLPLENSDMRRYNPQAFYDLGRALGHLMSLNDGARYLDIIVPGSSFQLMLRLIQNDLNISNGCKEGAKRLERAFAKIDEQIDKEKDDYFSEPIDAFSVRNAAKELDTLIKGECASLNLFYVPQVQAYDITCLIESAEMLLPEPIDKKLANYPNALADVREAGKCLAFKLWTGMGFHIARATEGLIQEYWKHARQAMTLPPKAQRTWVALCRDLEGKTFAPPSTKPPILPAGDQKLVRHLKTLGDDFRNPLIHPDQTLTEEDGQLFLSGCIAGMTRILSELP